MFSFNGGPGSASVWLHLGALGPRRIALPDDASFAKPPFTLTDNAATWLEFTDLVFIDPVGTGFSRAVKPELNKKFHSVRGDIESVAEFIRLYLTRNDRWGSPLYLVGESYGTTRAAGLSDALIDQGIALNGIVLVSSVLNFQTIRFGTGNDLPYVLYLPTYAATAWYHKKLSDALQKQPLGDLLAEVQKWAAGEYANALERGDRLTADERAAVVKKLSDYTGLSPAYIENSNLRVEIMHFCKELLRDRKRTVGRLDSRYTGMDESNVGERIENDPSMAAIRPPYTSTFAAYIRGDLGYKTDRPYYILGEGVGNWDYNLPQGGYADTSAALRDAMAKNPFMKVFVASGYYDLATPYFATEYTLSHMGLDAEQRKLFSGAEYEAGHMMYVHSPSLEKLKKDVSQFVTDSK
jgi:carboxypeptidase C (cathepsin A)